MSSMNNSHVGTSSYVKSTFVNTKPTVGRSATSLSEDMLKQTLGSISAETGRRAGTGNLQTATQAQVMATLRTTMSTNSYNSNNIITVNTKLENAAKSPDLTLGSFRTPVASFTKNEMKTFDRYATREDLSYYAMPNVDGKNSAILYHGGDQKVFESVSKNIKVDATIASGLNTVSNAASNIRTGATAAFGQLSKLSSREDLATASVGGVGTTGVAAVQTFEMAQHVSERGIAAGVAAAKGAVAVGDFTYKGVKTGVNFAQTMAVGREVTMLDGKAMDILKLHALENNLNQTKIAEGIIKTAQNINNGLVHGVNTAQTVINRGVQTGQYISNVAKSGIQITRNVFAGRNVAYQIQEAQRLAKEVGSKIVNASVKGIQTGARMGIKTAVKGMGFTVVKVLPKTGKILGKGSIGGWRFAAKFLKGTGNLGLEAMGNTMEAVYLSAKTTKAAVKSTKVAAKTTVKTGKTIVHAGKGAYRASKGVVKGVKFIKNNGLKKAWQEARKYGAKGAKALIKNIGKGLMEIVKRLGVKLAVPLALIMAVVMFLNILSAPAMAVGGMFGGVFSDGDSGAEVSVDDYLHDPTKGVSKRTTDIKNDIVDKLTNASSSYNIVRFRANTAEGEGGLVTEHTYDAVSNVFPSDDEIIEMVKPLFSAVILMEYKNSPTDAECQALLDHIMDKIFVVTSEETIEYCGQNVTTGEGEIAYCSSCGAVHAASDCPNPLASSTHSSYTCNHCCYMTCNGHTSYVGGGTTTTYCSGCTPACRGHIDCGGHSVETFKLNCDGIYSLVQEYFLDPIDNLENTSPRTADEEDKLKQLKEYYAIFEQMAQQFSVGAYSGGLTVEDISNVQWVNGSRTGCDAIIVYAQQFLGNVGGRTFWSDYGFSSRVAWCACYVYYVMRHSGYGESYPSSTNYAYCQTMADSFSAAGRFASRDFTDIVAGDVIYFDWGGDGHTDHTGLVIGRDETKVYTIEGNSGDQVKMKSYNLNSGVIYGYGLMNY